MTPVVTSARMPPLALAAAAGLHLLAVAAAIGAWQHETVAEEIRAIEIDLAALSPSRPEPDSPQPEASQPEAQSQPEPEPQAVEAPPIDPSIIPLPEPPPLLVLQPPKPPSPPPPKPAARPAPAPATAAPSPLPPALAPPTPPAGSLHDPSYFDRLASAIERERDYPMASRRRGEQGRVVLHLVIAANGRLLSSEIVTGSGVESLDRAALGMVRRATLPPLARGLGAESAAFTIPIVFSLR